ncbi:autotransporter outer membrane beta-barrel domain-containing protein [Amorphus coralli]|uniref:autotransporter outer membrane beta-barrel domain-containing protein n=1 Tax=Amorphus coralli TaxID=340680 RepID=UPI00035C6ABD|nr:autotransporter outer membrane beta-barrel domain-containing protein [Amorphus coralli]
MTSAISATLLLLDREAARPDAFEDVATLADANAVRQAATHKEPAREDLAFTEGCALALRGGLAYGELSTAHTTSLGSYSATASTDGHGFGGFAEATAIRAFDTPAVTLTPSATLGWRGFHRSSVDEAGSAFALSLPGQTFEETQTTLALAVSKRFVLDNGLVLEPVASVGWRHDFSDLDEAARLGLHGASFEADGAEIGSDAFLSRIDLTAMATDRFAFGASYQAEIRDNLTGHTFSAEASFRF